MTKSPPLKAIRGTRVWLLFAFLQASFFLKIILSKRDEGVYRGSQFFAFRVRNFRREEKTLLKSYLPIQDACRSMRHEFSSNKSIVKKHADDMSNVVIEIWRQNNWSYGAIICILRFFLLHDYVSFPVSCGVLIFYCFLTLPLSWQSRQTTNWYFTLCYLKK